MTPGAPRKPILPEEEERCDCCAPDCDCGDCEACSEDVLEVQGEPGASAQPKKGPSRKR